MKSQASAFEYYFLSQEFKELVGGRIDQIYGVENYFLFIIYTGKKRINLIIDIPEVAYLSSYKPGFSAPGGFVSFLRKRLKKGRITALHQIGFDRILYLQVQTLEKTYSVYIELFGKGNLVVCDENNIVISAKEYITTGERSIRGGKKYELPVLQPNLPEMSYDTFANHFGDEAAVHILASQLGLGGEYAEIILKKAGVPKDETHPDTQLLFDTMHSLLKEKKPMHTQTVASPILLSEGIEVETFSQAIAAIRDGQIEEAQEEKQLQKVDKIVSQVEKRSDIQQKQIQGFEKSAADNQRKGELLYEQYHELAPLLVQAKKDRKTLSSPEFIKKYSAHPLVKKADPQDFVIELE